MIPSASSYRRASNYPLDPANRPLTASLGGLTSRANSGKTYKIMRGWNIKPTSLIILASVLFIMLVIVVLPDVDLLDTAFHGGTAPVVVHTRATSAPAAITVPDVFQLPSASAEVFPHFRRLPMAANCAPNFLPILFRSIRR